MRASVPQVQARRGTRVPPRWRKEVERVLITETQLAQRVRTLAQEIERDFHGRVGTLTCRSAAHPWPETPAARELWDIACGAAGKNFLVVLTPNWNAEHKNHLHLELTTHDWVLVR